MSLKMFSRSNLKKYLNPLEFWRIVVTIVAKLTMGKMRWSLSKREKLGNLSNKGGSKHVFYLILGKKFESICSGSVFILNLIHVFLGREKRTI